MSKRNVVLTLTPAQARLLETILRETSARRLMKKQQQAAVFRMCDALAVAIRFASERRSDA